jgi:hypothetical protein
VVARSQALDSLFFPSNFHGGGNFEVVTRRCKHF